MITFFVCCTEADLKSIPTNVRVLGLKIDMGESSLAQKIRLRCDLGVLQGELVSGRWRSVAGIALLKTMLRDRDGGVLQSSFEASKISGSQDVWVITSCLTVDVAVAMCLLRRTVFRHLANSPETDATRDVDPQVLLERENSIRTRVEAIDHADAFSSGCISRWPGMQGGYSCQNPWRENGTPEETRALAALHQLVEWSRSLLSINETLVGIDAWLNNGLVPANWIFSTPLSSAEEAVKGGDGTTLLQIAYQSAYNTRFDLMTEFEKYAARPVLDEHHPGIAFVELKLTDATAKLEVALGSAALGLAPVSVVVFRNAAGRVARLRVTSFSRRYFDRETFLTLLARNDSEAGQLRWGQDSRYRYVTCLDLDEDDDAPFGYKTLIDLIGSIAR